MFNAGFMTKELQLQYFTEQEKRKADTTDVTNQSETKRIRIPIDIPLSCITNPTPTPSDIELLTRLFPSEHRYLLEMILQGCYGNILHAIQVITRSTSSTSSTTSPPVIPVPPQHPTTNLPSTTSNEPSLLNFGAGLLNSSYRYLYPGYVPPSSYLFSGSPGMGYFRPYFPKLTTTSSPVQLNSSTSSETTVNGDAPTPTTYNKEYNSLDMTPSPSPQREEMGHVCLKCNHKQKNGKICEQCGQHNLVVNLAENM